MNFRRYFLLPAASLLGLILLSACQSTPPDVAAHEDKLAAAGFVMRIADTPERRSMLSRLPIDQFVIRQSGNTIHYVYADPLVCGCLYVGTEQAFAQYQQNQRLANLANQEQLIAQMYEDPAWSWGAWGPWAPSMGFVIGRAGW
jgi:DNA-binding MarR family transcriptional regulator